MLEGVGSASLSSASLPCTVMQSRAAQGLGPTCGEHPTALLRGGQASGTGLEDSPAMGMIPFSKGF